MVFCLVLQPEQQKNVLQIRWVSSSGASMKRSHVLLGSRGVKAAATHPKGPSEDESLSTECSVEGQATLADLNNFATDPAPAVCRDRPLDSLSRACFIMHRALLSSLYKIRNDQNDGTESFTTDFAAFHSFCSGLSSMSGVCGPQLSTLCCLSRSHRTANQSRLASPAACAKHCPSNPF